MAGKSPAKPGKVTVRDNEPIEEIVVIVTAFDITTGNKVQRGYPTPC
jgi:hypothetical protein